MKHTAAAALLGLLFAGQASAQILVVPRSSDSLVYGGSSWRYAYQRGPAAFGGVYGSVSSYSSTFVYPPPAYTGIVLVPQSQIVVRIKYLPLLRGGYDQDTQGVDLDLVPPKKKKQAESVEPEPLPAKPLPGVDVSKSRPPVRPADAVEEIPVRPRELPPPKITAEPILDPGRQSARLMELGLGSLQEGEYGLAAQRFRKAAELTPNLPRTYFFLAQAEFAAGNYRDAVATIQAGMMIDKQWPRTTVQPRLDLFKGRDAEYSDLLKRLIDSVAGQPNQPTLLFLLAHQLWFDGRHADALAVFQRAKPLTDNPAFIDNFLATK